MADTWRSRRLLASMGRGAGTTRVVSAIGAAVVAEVTAALVSLWLKLILDGVGRQDSGAVTVTVAVLGVTATLQMAASSFSHLRLSELHMACGKVLVCDLMEAGAIPPGIEHHERPDHADRIALLKRDTNYLSGFLPVIGEAVALVARVGVTGILLARVHPALLLLPALSVPSFSAGRRAERAVNAAKEATAEQDRLNEHLFTLATTPSQGLYAELYGIQARAYR